MSEINNTKGNEFFLSEKIYNEINKNKELLYFNKIKEYTKNDAVYEELKDNTYFLTNLNKKQLFWYLNWRYKTVNKEVISTDIGYINLFATELINYTYSQSTSFSIEGLQFIYDNLHRNKKYLNWKNDLINEEATYNGEIDIENIAYMFMKIFKTGEVENIEKVLKFIFREFRIKEELYEVALSKKNIFKEYFENLIKSLKEKCDKENLDIYSIWFKERTPFEGGHTFFEREIHQSYLIDITNDFIDDIRMLMINVCGFMKCGVEEYDECLQNIVDYHVNFDINDKDTYMGVVANNVYRLLKNSCRKDKDIDLKEFFELNLFISNFELKRSDIEFRNVFEQILNYLIDEAILQKVNILKRWFVVDSSKRNKEFTIHYYEDLAVMYFYCENLSYDDDKIFDLVRDSVGKLKEKIDNSSIDELGVDVNKEDFKKFTCADFIDSIEEFDEEMSFEDINLKNEDIEILDLSDALLDEDIEEYEINKDCQCEEVEDIEGVDLADALLGEDIEEYEINKDCQCEEVEDIEGVDLADALLGEDIEEYEINKECQCEEIEDIEGVDLVDALLGEDIEEYEINKECQCKEVEDIEGVDLADALLGEDIEEMNDVNELLEKKMQDKIDEAFGFDEVDSLLAEIKTEEKSQKLTDLILLDKELNDDIEKSDLQSEFIQPLEYIKFDDNIDIFDNGEDVNMENIKIKNFVRKTKGEIDLFKVNIENLEIHVAELYDIFKQSKENSTSFDMSKAEEKIMDLKSEFSTMNNELKEFREVLVNEISKY